MELSTAERIFNIRYLVDVPAYALESNLVKLSKNVATSDDHDMAEAESMFPTTVNYPISRLALLADNGVSISLKNPKDSLTIYRAIQDHLTAWRKAAQENMHKLKVPIESLECLDKFAAIIYPIARQHMAVGIRTNAHANPFVNFINERTGKKEDKENRIDTLPVEHSTEIEDLSNVAMRREVRNRR